MIPELTITPEVARSQPLSEEARGLMLATLGEYTYELWATFHWYCGSGYHVELPHYINGLVEAGQQGKARLVLSSCFCDSGIPDSHWRKMVNYREKGILE